MLCQFCQEKLYNLGSWFPSAEETCLGRPVVIYSELYLQRFLFEVLLNLATPLVQNYFHLSPLRTVLSQLLLELSRQC